MQQTAAGPFVVALALAKDYTKSPHQFDKFVGVFQVKATGNRLTHNSIETEILERLRAK